LKTNWFLRFFKTSIVKICVYVELNLPVKILRTGRAVGKPMEPDMKDTKLKTTRASPGLAFVG
jgi:hypothetical protein